jgi:uncharacterized protein (DUF1697 family)
MPARYVALLRGINVGGKNKLPMKDLSAMFVAAGCTDVQTYIQSGNVVFKAPASLAAKISGLIASQIAERFGYKTPVVLRTTEQIDEILRNNPFFEVGATEDTLHVLFLADLPNPQAISLLDPDRSPGDTYVVRGRDIYLRLPNGVADSKLTNAYFDSKLATVSTGRNWRTIGKLLELLTR